MLGITGLNPSKTGRQNPRRTALSLLGARTIRAFVALGIVITGLASVGVASAAVAPGVIKTIPFSNAFIYGVGLDSSKGTVVLVVESNSIGNLWEISEATDSVTVTNSFGPNLRSVAVDPTTGTYFVTQIGSSTGNYLDPVDEATDTLITDIATGIPGSVAVDPVTGNVFLALGDGFGVQPADSLEVLQGSTCTASIPLGCYHTPTLIPGVTGSVAVNPASGIVYVAGNDISNNYAPTLWEVSEATDTVVATMPLSGQVGGVAVDPVTDTVYVADTTDDTVQVINGSTNTVAATVPVGSDPTALAVDQVTGAVYVTNYGSNTVSVINEPTNTVTTTIPVNGGPKGVVVDPVTDLAYVITGSTLVVIGPTTAYASPIAAADSYNTTQDVTLTATAANGVLANDTDPNGLPLTATLVSGPSDGSLTLGTDGSFTYVPNSGFYGADSFTYQDSDGEATSNIATVAIAVNAVACPAGSYSATGDEPCTPAPAGYFDAGTGNTGDVACPAGTYSGVAGQASCTTTPAGYYDAGTANTTDFACPTGTTSPAGASACTASSIALVYNGPNQVAVSSSFSPTATLSSTAAACVAQQPVSFSLSPNPLNGSATAYNLGTANASARGGVTGPSVSTSGWQDGVYAITASYAGSNGGTVICPPSTTTASLAVTVPGQLAFGAGSYNVANLGPTTFGFVVAQALHGSYVGVLNLLTPGKWWFQANITTYGRTSSTQGLLGGTGSLYWWNSALDKGHGAWQLATASVIYAATANATTRSTLGSFGTTFNYTPVMPQPALTPYSSPVALAAGGIVIG